MKKVQLLITGLVIMFCGICRGEETPNASIVNNSIILNVQNTPAKFTDKVYGKFTVRNYVDFTCTDKPGTYKLPSRDILVAIPYNTRPEIKVIDKKETIYKNIIPEINPTVELASDSTLIFKQNNFSAQLNTNIKKDIVEIKGFSKYRDFYCIHLKINTHSFNSSELSEIISLKIELKFNDGITSAAKTKNNGTNDDIYKQVFYNSDMADQFRITAAAGPGDTTGNWINYNATYLKLNISADGIYRLTKSDFSKAGIDVTGINPKTFRMYESGKEMKLFVSGELDNVFNDDDYVEFFGTQNYSKISNRVINKANQEYNEYLNRYSDTSVYFLTWGGDNGLRVIVDSSGFQQTSDTLNYYKNFQHYEVNNSYQNLNNDEVANQTSNWLRNKTWIWDWIGIGTQTYTFTASSIYPNKTSRLVFKLVSGGSNTSQNSHNILLTLNNTKIDSQQINRFDQVLMNGSLNSNSLINGTNKLVVNNLENGNPVNVIISDWFEIEYPRQLRLVNDSLYFEVPEDIKPGYKCIKIAGASAAELLIYKTSPILKQIRKYSLIAGNVLFYDTVNIGDKYIVLRNNNPLKPMSIAVKMFTNLRKLNKQADYLAITHPLFFSAADNYTSQVTGLYKQTKSLINIADIQDEFGYGYNSPEAIKGFVSYALDYWPVPKPQYLVLIGDACYDYKGYLKKNAGVRLAENYIPSYGYPVSDTWYTIRDTSLLAIPQMKVGRLPIKNASELNYYLEKVKSNFNSMFDQSNKKYLFFSSGSSTDPDEVITMRAVNTNIINNIIAPKPISGRYYHFYKTTDPKSDFGPYTSVQLMQAISDGGLFISYIGHSGTSTWDNSINDITQLKNNTNRYPLITDFGCSTNKFAEPDIICFGKKFVLWENGQAIAYLGNTSLGFSITSTTVPFLFYSSVIKDSVREVGAAHLSAKIRMFGEYGNSDVYKVFSLTNNLTGDPIVQLKIPTKPNFAITAKDFSKQLENINESMDSALVRVAINNFGTSPRDSVSVSIIHSKNGAQIGKKILKVLIPDYSDTVDVWCKVKNLTGEHTLNVTVDAENKIDEIYKTDNNAAYIFNVYSTSLRDMLPYTLSNGGVSSVNILSPAKYNSSQIPIKLLLSDNEAFSAYTQYTATSDSSVTGFNFNQISKNKRYWLKYKVNESSAEYSVTKSFYNNDFGKYNLSDSISLNSLEKNKTFYNNSCIKLNGDSAKISVLSAGYYAGETCVIAKNGINLLPTSYFAGMGIVVFNEKSYDIDTSASFNLFNLPLNMKALVSLINNIPQGKIVAIGVSDDAANNITQELKTAIKTLGSTKIDSLKMRSSWGIIGVKGGVPGSALEAYKAPYDGMVYIEKTASFNHKNGMILTGKIGPASNWKTLRFEKSIPVNSTLTYSLLGYKTDGSMDTIVVRNNIDSLLNLGNIDAKKYPYLKLLSDFGTSLGSDSPEIKSIAIDYSGVPEMLVNYQGVSLSADTIITDKTLDVKCKIYNAGELPAENFKVNFSLKKPDNTYKPLGDTLITRLDANSSMPIKYSYKINSADGLGKMAFVIAIDTANKITEIYKDNNFYEAGFYVKRDTLTSLFSATAKVTFDGKEISDGDFVSLKPEIKITINYSTQFPYNDTSSVQVYLDGTRLNSQQVQLLSNDTSLRQMIFHCAPLLDEGEHFIKITGQNLIGNIKQLDGYERYFEVNEKLKLLSVYNFPNPFKDKTNFTFRLTQIPEEVNIKIYTVAGRIIKDIKVSGSGLQYDFNVIPWDGKDQDGDWLANGLYFYKIIAKKNGSSETVTQKLAKVK